MKVRTLFGANSGYSGHMKASSSSNRVGRLTSIKHREDGVFLSRKDGSHDDMVGNKEVCELFQTQT